MLYEAVTVPVVGFARNRSGFDAWQLYHRFDPSYVIPTPMPDWQSWLKVTLPTRSPVAAFAGPAPATAISSELSKPIMTTHSRGLNPSIMKDPLLLKCPPSRT